MIFARAYDPNFLLENMTEERPFGLSFYSERRKAGQSIKEKIAFLWEKSYHSGQSFFLNNHLVLSI